MDDCREFLHLCQEGRQHSTVYRVDNVLIPNPKEGNAGVKLIMQTGLFKQKYDEWHKREEDLHPWAYFRIFWPLKVQSKQHTQ